ncbi:MAG TPA: hypothetical protein VM095_04655 [Pyrinomonadaceae bacterium]|nr:hypothetical protein [Pyrinomonadaceae bacterium]
MRRHGLPHKLSAASLIVFLSGMFGVVMCQQSRAKTDESFEVIKTDEFEGVIITREKAMDFMKAFSGLDEKGAWTPGRSSVLKLEERIEAYLKKAAAKRSPALWSKLAKYKRQYVGVMRNGRKVIFVNFFCDAFDADWKNNPVAVDDGGDCFFNLLYDPGSYAFSDLQINGEA